MSEPGEIPATNPTPVTDLPEQIMLRLDDTAVLLPPASDHRVLRLAVQAVHCYPTNGEQTKLTRRAMNALVANAQDIYERISDEDKVHIRRLKGTPKFSMSMQRMLSLMDKEGSSNYEVIYKAIDAIFKWELKWNVMNDSWPDGTPGGFLALPSDEGPTSVVGLHAGDEISSRDTARFISHWGRGEGRMAGTFHYYFPHDVMLMLMEPSRYAQIDLHTANGLGSNYAVELYHNCVRYIGTEKKLTPILPLEEWIRLIAGAGKYDGRYKDFKRYALVPACDWLEKTETCPFTVEIRESYGPRKRVVGLQFKLTMKVQASLDMRMPPTWSPDLIDVLRKVYAMSNRDIKELALTASEAEVNEAMARDSVMVQRKAAQGNPVENRANYLRGILRNVQNGNAKDAEPVDVNQETPSRDVQDAVSRVIRLQTEFDQYRMKRLSEMLAELPNSVVEELREKFADARGHESVVSAWLKHGWTKPKAGLMATFVEWFSKTYPEKVSSMLVAPQEVDFNVWVMLRQSENDGAK